MPSNADDPLPDLIKSLKSPLPDIRARAARSLGKLGWLAKDALPLLAKATDDADPGVREAAAGSMAPMGPEAVPHLVRLLTHEDKYVRRNAVWGLGKLGPLARAALPDLCAALRDADARTASGAAQSIGQMGADAADAVPALTEAMRGTNIVICRLAAKALSQIGRPALTALIVHVKHRDPFVRGEAALALGWMGAIASPAVPSLIEVLKSARSVPRPAAVAAGSRTPSTPLTNAPSDPGPTAEETSRVHAAQALGRIGPGASPAVAVLTQALQDPSEPVRQAAQTALRQIKGE